MVYDVSMLYTLVTFFAVSLFSIGSAVAVRFRLQFDAVNYVGKFHTQPHIRL